MNIKKINEAYQKLYEGKYHVYSPSEESEEGLTPENRTTFDGRDIRNIAMYYMMVDSMKFNEFVRSLSDDNQYKLVGCYLEAVEACMPKINDQYDVLAELNAGEFVMKRHQNIINRTQRLLLDELNDDTIIAFLQQQDDTVVEPIQEEFEEYQECAWCGEEYEESDMTYDEDMGWLCDRCVRALESRGELNGEE